MAMITVINNKQVNKRTFHLLWRYLLAWNRNFIFHFAPSIIIFICHSCIFIIITTFVGSRDAMTVLVKVLVSDVGSQYDFNRPRVGLLLYNHLIILTYIELSNK